MKPKKGELWLCKNVFDGFVALWYYRGKWYCTFEWGEYFDEYELIGSPIELLKERP